MTDVVNVEIIFNSTRADYITGALENRGLLEGFGRAHHEDLSDGVPCSVFMVYHEGGGIYPSHYSI